MSSAQTRNCLLLLSLLAAYMDTEAATCCLHYTEHPRRCGTLKGYDIQGIRRGCDIPAIIFHSKSGKLICANPEQRWTQLRILCLKKKATALKSHTSLL